MFKQKKLFLLFFLTIVSIQSNLFAAKIPIKGKEQISWKQSKPTFQIPQELTVPFVMEGTLNNNPKKLILALIYKTNDTYAKIYSDPNNPSFSAFKNLCLQRAKQAGAGKLVILPIGREEKKASATGLGSLFGIKTIIDEKQREKNATAIKNLLNTLAKQDQQNTQITTYAFGESAHVVNLVSRKQPGIIDTMIHIQSPIYEYGREKMFEKYQAIEKYTPTGFNRLYNIYTKASFPAPTLLKTRYPARKYRQQARKENNQVIMPVKNIRAIKVARGKTAAFTEQIKKFITREQVQYFATQTLSDVTVQDMHTPKFIDQIGNTIAACEQYHVNFDLLGRIFNENYLQNESTLVVNRFISEEKNDITFVSGGLAKTQQYTVAANLNNTELNNVKTAFTQDADLSAGEFVNLADVSSIQRDLKLGIVWSGLQTDLDRIKAALNTIQTNPLYALVIEPILNQQYVTAQLKKLESDALPPKYILNKIYLGGVYAYELLYGNPQNIPTNGQKQYIESITALMWYLYSEAINKDQGYVEGTFIIRDYDGKIFNFLINYANRFNPKIDQGQKNPFGYQRASSHFKQYQNNHKHYGIDIRIGKEGSTLPFLPAGKRHILFSKIENGKSSFIKMENWGLYGIRSTIEHGKEFAVAQARKVESIRNQLGLRSDDDPLYRKERIPNDFKKKIKIILEKINHPKTKEILAKINADGIQVIVAEKYNQLLYPDETTKSTLNSKLKPLLDSLAKQYDYTDRRYGREVILTPKELFSSLYYYMVATNNPLANQFKAFAESVIKKQPINFDKELVKKYYDPNTIQILFSYVNQLKLEQAKK